MTSGSRWIDEKAGDQVDERHAQRARAARRSTRFIYIHRCGLARLMAKTPGAPVDELEAVSWFYTQHPEGIGCVTIAGFYRGDWQATVRDWKANGVPEANRRGAAAAYHLSIHRDGRLALNLPLDLEGAHALGANGRSVAVALLGDFREEHPTQEMELTLKKTLRELVLLYPEARVVTHTEGNSLLGIRSSKQCPGARAMPMVKRSRVWAGLAARHVRQGPSRW